MNYLETKKYLEDLPKFNPMAGPIMNLESVRALLNEIGNPQNKLSYVHITGTNGKGSTTTYLKYLLKDQLKVGSFTSPFIQEYTEMICIGLSEIPQKDFSDILSILKPSIDKLNNKGIYPSEFEILVSIAFYYFEREKVDLILLEVGLGGLLDATNIIPPPLVAILTNISLEHQQVLGNTIEEIALHKSGIIKEGSQVFTYHLSKEVDQIIENQCHLVKGNLEFLDLPTLISSTQNGQVFFSTSLYPLEEIYLNQLGPYQPSNCTLALKTYLYLKKFFKLDLSLIQETLSKVYWPGRFEVLKNDPIIIVDGAHNLAGIQQLTTGLSTYFPNRKIHFLIGLLKDKDYTEMIDQLASLGESFHILPVDSTRALKTEILKEYFLSIEKTNVYTYLSVKEGLDDTLSRYPSSDIFCICGSLYLLKDIYSYFKNL